MSVFPSWNRGRASLPPPSFPFRGFVYTNWSFSDYGAAYGVVRLPDQLKPAKLAERLIVSLGRKRLLLFSFLRIFIFAEIFSVLEVILYKFVTCGGFEC